MASRHANDRLSATCGELCCAKRSSQASTFDCAWPVPSPPTAFIESEFQNDAIGCAPVMWRSSAVGVALESGPPASQACARTPRIVLAIHCVGVLADTAPYATPHMRLASVRCACGGTALPARCAAMAAATGA